MCMESLERYRANIIFLLDTSGSMCGEKICKLNTLMAEAVNVAEEAAMKKEVQLFVPVIMPQSGAESAMSPLGS